MNIKAVNSKIVHKSKEVQAIVTAMGVGIAVGVVIMSTSCSMNPARELGPRIAATIVGFGNIPWDSGYWMIPTFTPILGMVLASLFWT